MSDVKVDIVPLDSLRPDPDNARQHNPRNIGVIKDSIETVGTARSGVIDEDGVILAGNGMTEAAAQAGLTEAIVVEVDGTRPVFVKRTGLSREEKLRLAIDDNRANELSAFDPAALARLTDECRGLRDRWTDDEWSSMMGAVDTSAGPVDAGDAGTGVGNYSEQYGVIVLCENEGDQKDAYDRLMALGFKCRVVTT